MRGSVVLTMLAALTMVGCGGDEAETGDEGPSETAGSSAPASEAEATPTVAEFEVTADLAYADGVLLDVYHAAEAGPWPVVVFAPGKGATKEVAKVFGESYAENGAVAYIITMSDDPPFLETVEDVACAVRYARATAAEYGGDPDNVTLVGFSLGAHVGAVVALSGDDHTTGCVTTDTSALPDGFVGYEGPYDWVHADYPEDLRIWNRTIRRCGWRSTRMHTSGGIPTCRFG